jgi:hypothetical protein
MLRALMCLASQAKHLLCHALSQLLTVPSSSDHPNGPGAPVWLPSLLGRHRSAGPSHGPQAWAVQSLMSCHKCPVSRVRGHFTFPQEDWHQAHSGDCDATVSCELEVDEMVVSDGVRHFTFQVFSRCFFPIVQPNIAKLKPNMSPHRCRMTLSSSSKSF